MPRLIHAALILLLTAPALAGSPRELLLAARSGDLAEVERLVEGGLDVDAGDNWGTTPLALAARNGQVEVARYLLDKGADPGARETFFGASVLDFALWTGAPEFEIARMLLAAGAEDRASALRRALRTGSIELATAAVESGPVFESEAAELRRLLDGEEGEPDSELAEIVARVETRPDPPPPSYTAEELAGFTGYFERGDSPAAVIVVRDGRLALEIAGQRIRLQPAAEREFRDAEGDLTVSFFGRAGTIEGLSMARAGRQPLRYRLGEVVEFACVALKCRLVSGTPRPTSRCQSFSPLPLSKARTSQRCSLCSATSSPRPVSPVSSGTLPPSATAVVT